MVDQHLYPNLIGDYKVARPRSRDSLSPLFKPYDNHTWQHGTPAYSDLTLW